MYVCVCVCVGGARTVLLDESWASLSSFMSDLHVRLAWFRSLVNLQGRAEPCDPVRACPECAWMNERAKFSTWI